MNEIMKCKSRSKDVQVQDVQVQDVQVQDLGQHVLPALCSFLFCFDNDKIDNENSLTILDLDTLIPTTMACNMWPNLRGGRSNQWYLPDMTDDHASDNCVFKPDPKKYHCLGVVKSAFASLIKIRNKKHKMIFINTIQKMVQKNTNIHCSMIMHHVIMNCVDSGIIHPPKFASHPFIKACNKTIPQCFDQDK